MATKKTQSKKSAAPKARPAAKKPVSRPSPARGKAGSRAKPAPKAPRAPKATLKVGPRHPRARVIEAHGSKVALAATLAKALARPDQDTGLLESQLKKASNAQLLRLHRATQTLKEKYGNRDKLIAAIGAATRKGKDKDYLAKLETYSLPQLLDLAASSQRRTQAPRA
jgi:hypothetical protein